MGRSAKPRKPYNANRHRVHVPMHTETRNSLALDMHTAVETMVAEPSSAVATRLARILASLATAINYSSPIRIRDRKDADAMAVCGAMEALQCIEARFDRLGRYGVSGDEAKALRAAAGGLDESLARIPFNVLQESIRTVNRSCA